MVRLREEGHQNKIKLQVAQTDDVEKGLQQVQNESKDNVSTL
jgi:hypothetical protein